MEHRGYEIARIRNYGGYQITLASMFYKIFDKKAGSGISLNEQLAKELHEPVIKNFKKEMSMWDLKAIFENILQWLSVMKL